jgi:hypothetical protein
MNLYIVAVYDKITEAYGVPSFVVSVGAALRGFTDEVNRPSDDNMFNKHSADFELFLLGTYDDSVGELHPDKPRLLARGHEVKKSD